MLMSLTLEEANSLFRKYCDAHKKLFLPGSNDEAIVRSLSDFYIKYFSLEILEKSIEYYVKNSHEPVLIYNFAIESSKIREHIVKEQEISEDFNHLLIETKKRMEQMKREGGQ
jgi:hypothetical protein